MKIISLVIIVVGIILLVGAYMSPSLAVITVNYVPTNTGPMTGTLVVENAFPSSTFSSAPTQMAYGTQIISVVFRTPVLYDSPYVAHVSNVSGTLKANGVLLTPKITQSNISVDPKLYGEYLTIVLTYSYTPPSLGATVAFTWTAAMTVTGWTPQYSTKSTTTITWSGSATYYAKFGNANLTNIGSFYVSLTGPGTSPTDNIPVEVMNSSSIITFETTSFPVVLNIYYVENNGTTEYMSRVYVTFGSQVIQLYPVSSSSGSTSTTVDGYQAYENSVIIKSVGEYNLFGYIQASSAANNKTVQLMSFGIDLPTSSSQLPPSLTLSQIATMAMGAFFVLVGMIGAVTRRF